MARVTVGLPVYNGERYLAEALSSLAAQTFQDLEIVISDNGSTDRTSQICTEFAASDPRVRYIRHDTNRGAAFNHNYVVRAATGEYFRWYAYDDRLAPTCIEACVRALDADPSVVLAWPQTTVIDATGQPTGDYRTDLPWDDRNARTRLLSLLGEPTHQTLLHMCYPVYGLMRREVLLQTHLLGTNVGADTVLLVELALRGSWQQVPQRLFFNRRHAGSSAVNKSPEAIATWFDPNRSPRYPMTRGSLFAGYLRAVQTAPLTARERAECLAIVASWCAHDHIWRVICGEARIRARQYVAGLGAARSACPSATTSGSTPSWWSVRRISSR